LSSGGLPGAALRRVLEHIETNLHRDPPLAELSALVHMSLFHFARLFKASTGLPPHRFVVQQRIEHAKQLLARADVSIAAVGRDVGFRTASHFTSAFHRVTGLTPTAYRAQQAAAMPDSC
jgi:AraC family transcriptional regulator